MNISITALTAKGSRANNQDSLLLGRNLIAARESPFVTVRCIMQQGSVTVFAVADGAGGGEAGEEASEAALRVLAEQNFADINDFRERLDDCFDSMQAAVEDALGHRQGGTTVSVLAVGDGQYVCANLGDSPVYKASAGRLRLVSDIHTEAAEKLAAGAGKREITYRDRHCLTQCLGSTGYDSHSFSSGAAAQGDVFLLCSDGFNENFRKSRLLRELHRPSGRLVLPDTYAYARDNCSAIIIRINRDDS